MIPDYQTLMRPVLEAAQDGEVKISDVVAKLEDSFELSQEEKAERLQSGKQTKIANRVHWARSYLKQAGLVENKRRGYFSLTERGRTVLREHVGAINVKYLERFPDFIEFRERTRDASGNEPESQNVETTRTPDEVLRKAHKDITASLAAEFLDRLRASEPAFFEAVIVELLLKMGYGAESNSGQVVGQSGDDGVDGVINQDPLGVDQVYVQAKRYHAGNAIGAGSIRDFYGALGLKDVSKGIFVTTSYFTPSAVETAEKLGARIVLIDGIRLAQLLIKHAVGVRVIVTFAISEIEEGFFE